MLSKKIVLAFLSVSMLVFVVVAQAYGQMSGTSEFLDSIGNYICLFNLKIWYN